MYYGKMREGMCHGKGMVFCSFQQYKEVIFKNDLMEGKCIKMSLNWGFREESTFK